MSDLTDLDLRVIKLINAVVAGFRRVQKHSRRVYVDLKSDAALDKTLIRQASKQMLSFMTKFAAASKLRRSKAFTMPCRRKAWKRSDAWG